MGQRDGEEGPRLWERGTVDGEGEGPRNVEMVEMRPRMEGMVGEMAREWQNRWLQQMVGGSLGYGSFKR